MTYKMSDVLRGPVAEFKRVVQSNVLFQSVSCHTVFAERQSVTPEQFDQFVHLLREHPLFDKEEFLAELREVYSCLLDSGFFDTYLGIYFDVNQVTSFVTVVSNMVYTFDMKYSKLSPEKRSEFTKSFVDRCSRVNFLREFGAVGDLGNVRSVENVHVAKESARYFCLTSVLEEMVSHALLLEKKCGISSPHKSSPLGFYVPSS